MNKELRNIVKAYHMGDGVSAASYTGADWREKKPVRDRNRCFKCGMCYLSCPDAAILQVEDGYYDIHLDICKGCGICARECLNDAIIMTPEGK